ncbi:MAG: hypothetical protein ACKO91_09230 [Acidimicrobiales bacterium]
MDLRRLVIRVVLVAVLATVPAVAAVAALAALAAPAAAAATRARPDTSHCRAPPACSTPAMAPCRRRGRPGR